MRSKRRLPRRKIRKTLQRESPDDRTFCVQASLQGISCTAALLAIQVETRQDHGQMPLHLLLHSLFEQIQ